VIGWTAEPFEGSPEPYLIFSAEAPAAGLMALPEAAKSQGAPPHWMSYVYTPALDATCQKLESLGGKILMPAEAIPEVGRFSVLQDPQGAVIGLMEPTEPPPAQPDKAPVGQFCWAELAATDRHAAFRFYADLFGWRETENMDMGEGNIYQMFGASDDVTLGGIYIKPAEMPISAWLYYTTVADLDAALATTTALGGQVLNGPMEVPGGDRIAQCLDPQGAAFALHASAD